MFLQIDKKLFTWLTPRDVHDRPQFTALICLINNPVPKSEYAASFLVTVYAIEQSNLGKKETTMESQEYFHIIIFYASIGT